MKSENRERQHSRQDSRDLVSSQAAILVASTTVTFIAARILGPEGRGSLAFVVAAGNLFASIAYGSLHVGLSHAFATGDQSALRRGKHLGARQSFVVLALLGVCAVVVRATWGPELAWKVALAAVGAALLCFYLVISRTRQGIGDARAFRNGMLIQSGSYTLLGLLAAILTRSPVAVVSAWFCAIILSIIYVVRGYERPVAMVAGQRNWSTRDIVRSSLAAHIGFVGIQVLYRADVVILAFVVSAADVGIYSLAAPIAEITWVLSEALSLLAFSRIQPGQDLTDAASRRRRLLLVNVIVSGVVAVLIAIATIFLLPIVLPAYTRCVLLVLILLPGTLIQGTSRVAFSALVAMGARKPSVLVGLFSIALALLYLPGALLFGIEGAAATASMIYAVQALFVFLLSRRWTSRRPQSELAEVT